MEFVKTYLSELLWLLNEMAPYLLMGFLFAGLLRVVFPAKIITRFLGGSNLKSVVNASLLGVPMPLCSCGVLPAGIGFYKNGASRGSTVSFLISTPQTGVDSILATYSMLGLPLAIIRPIVALVSGIGGGVLSNLTGGEKRGKEEESGNGSSKGHERNLRELLRYGFVELVQDVSKWLIIGLLLAALLSVLIPDDFFINYAANEYLAMILMLLASVPMYICATGSIPIAAVLMMKGLAPGAALVLLMAGPATNIATMAVIGNTMGRRTLWVYLASIIGGALIFGTIVNEFIPRDWIMGHLSADAHTHGGMEHMAWWAWASSALLLALILNGYLLKIFRSRRLRTNRSTKSGLHIEPLHSYVVEGMTCSNCAAKVEAGIARLPSVSGVEADPAKNRLSFRSKGSNDEEVKDLIEKLGYKFRGKI